MLEYIAVTLCAPTAALKLYNVLLTQFQRLKSFPLTCRTENIPEQGTARGRNRARVAARKRQRDAFQRAAARKRALSDFRHIDGNDEAPGGFIFYSRHNARRRRRSEIKRRHFFVFYPFSGICHVFCRHGKRVRKFRAEQFLPLIPAEERISQMCGFYRYRNFRVILFTSAYIDDFTECGIVCYRQLVRIDRPACR